MHTSFFAVFKIFRKFSGNVFPKRFPLMLSIPNVLPLKKGHFQAHLFSKIASIDAAFASISISIAQVVTGDTQQALNCTWGRNIFIK